MANNQNRGNNPAMTLEKITDVVREFVSLYTQQAQTNENRKQLISQYRNMLINQDMKKVNRILAARINHVKRHENVDADLMRIDLIPDTGSNTVMKNIAPNSDAKGYSMIIRTQGGKFLFAKSLMHQRDSKWVPMLFGAPNAGKAIMQNARRGTELENAVRLTMRFLVALVEQTIGHQSDLPAQAVAFNDLCDNVTLQIVYYLNVQPTPPGNPRHIYKVKLKSVRTNNPVQTARYFEEVFSRVRIHCGRIEGHPTGRSKCPVLPILLNADFFAFASTPGRSPRPNANLFADFDAIQFPGVPGGATFDMHLTQIRQGYQNPESAATRANGDITRFIEPISKLMNDHLMNLSTLQSSLAGLSTLASVTQNTINLHFGVQDNGVAPVSMHEVVNHNRVLGYVSQGAENKGTKIMMVSNTFLNQATQGLSLDVGKLFNEFNPRTPNNVHNTARNRSRGIKKTQQVSLVSDLRKIDPLLQSLNRLRFGKTTSNNRINTNNNIIRMNYNSNTAPARLFVDMVFKEILKYKTGSQYDRKEFRMVLRSIYSSFSSSRGVNVQKLKNKMNRKISPNAVSNLNRAMRNVSNNNQTMSNVDMATIKQLIDDMRYDFKNLFTINKNGDNLLIRSAISGKFVLGSNISNGQNEWDYVSWFLSSVELANKNRASNSVIKKLISTHKLVVSAVFALITQYHAQFTSALLKPITRNENNVRTRLHRLNEDQKSEAISKCYSVAHAKLFFSHADQYLPSKTYQFDANHLPGNAAEYVSNLLLYTYNKRQEVVVQEFSKNTSSAAAYLWYDCGDTHAMQVAVEATSKLVSQLKQLGFANYPISGYVASTSPLFEQSVILKQTGMLCAPIFLETLRRQLGNASLNQKKDMSYGDASTKNIHHMLGIEYRGSTPSFIDSISNRPNNIPNTFSITENARDPAKSLHTYFLDVYKSLPAYQKYNHRFRLVLDDVTIPYTTDKIQILDSVVSLERLMNFDYWKLRRSFWVSHFYNLQMSVDKTQRLWVMSTLETPQAQQSLSLLERVLAYWQMYKHKDRNIGANPGGNRKNKDNGSNGKPLNDRLIMEYSMAIRKSKQMQASFKFNKSNAMK